VLAKSITLIESRRADDQAVAREILDRLISKTGNSIRVGITGVPGVGKSTFIEALGTYLTGQQKKVAVLTVDPSSLLTKGSILGDKTRMEELAKNPKAFIRPTSSGETLGGVATKTREAMLLCEAAGFEVILVETVGVGQSEVEVRNMVDFFLLLMLAGAGDELQGIKKGIMEMADAVVITKADGENVKKANEARAEYQHAFHLLRPDESGWVPKVLTCSALQATGIQEVWELITLFRDKLTSNGTMERRRNQQIVAWMHNCLDELLKTKIQNSKEVTSLVKKMEEQVMMKNIAPSQAAEAIATEIIRVLRNKES
jgi:LAO/AO transport system kinase